ncbi:MAG: hypothetical protein RH946_00740 [Rhodospirillales bacterium]
MKTYKLSGDYPLLHGGKEYLPGDDVKMDEKLAASKVESGRLIDLDASPEDDGEGMLIGSSVLPAEIEIGEGTVIQLGKLVGFTQEQSGLDINGWNKQPEADREAFLERVLKRLQAFHQAGVANKDKNPTVGEVKKILGEDIDGKSKDAAWAFLESLKPAAT